MADDIQIDKITDGIYVSDIYAVIQEEGRKKIRELKIKRVLSAVHHAHGPVEKEQLPGVDYKNFFMFDTADQDLLGNGLLQKALDYIKDAESKKEPILVHCMAGVSRSVTLVCAHLMRKNKWTAERAIDYVKSKRDMADPNVSFRLQLKIFEEVGYVADPVAISESPVYKKFASRLNKFGIKPLKGPDDAKKRLQDAKDLY